MRISNRQINVQQVRHYSKILFVCICHQLQSCMCILGQSVLQTGPDSLVHGGSSFCLLADPIVTYISGTDIADIVVPAEDIQDAETKILIDQVITRYVAV